jgi:RNA polymerase sigma-70 factor (ECF subfamily)
MRSRRFEIQNEGAQNRFDHRVQGVATQAVLQEGIAKPSSDALYREGGVVLISSGLEQLAETLRPRSDELADELLVSAAHSGNAYAFVELSKHHSRKLLLTTYRITNNWQDAEDAVQESLMKAFIHLSGFESRSIFSTWLTRIAINSAISLLRKRRNTLLLKTDNSTIEEADGEALDLPDRRDNPEQCYIRRQTEDRLREAIQRMPPEYRQVIELRETGDLPMTEIARTLCISVPAAKSRLLRARKELRKCLKGVISVD